MKTLLSEKEVSKLWSDAHNDTSDRMAHQVLATLVEQRLIAKLIEGVGEPRFSSWHCERDKSLINPSGICNAFPWPPRNPEDEYWVAKGFHGEPLYTAEQLAAAVLAERERCAAICDDWSTDAADEIAAH